MTVMRETFDLANGTVPTNANTVFAELVILDATVVADTSVKKVGTASVHKSGTGSVFFGDRAPEPYRRFYIRPAANPPANTVIAYGRDTADTTWSWDVRLTTAGKLQLRNSSLAQVAITAASLPAGEWSRVALYHSAGTLTARIFTGTAVDAAADAFTEQISGAYAGAEPQKVIVGAATSNAWEMWLDDYRTGTSWVGPDGVAVAPLVAAAGANQTVAAGATFTLTGSATGGTAPYTYAWAPVTSGAPALSGSGASRSGTAPSSGGPYTYRLTVSDSGGMTATATTVLTVQPAPTLTVDGGDDRTVAAGEVVRVTVTSSGGTAPVRLDLRHTSGPVPASSFSRSGDVWTFVAPRTYEGTTLGFRATATDSAGQTAAPDTFVVTVQGDPDVPPVGSSTARPPAPTGWDEYRLLSPSSAGSSTGGGTTTPPADTTAPTTTQTSPTSGSTTNRSTTVGGTYTDA